MENQEGDIDYANIIETLTNTFGDVLSTDCMFAIVESCGGNRKYRYTYNYLYDTSALLIFLAGI